MTHDQAPIEELGGTARPTPAPLGRTRTGLRARPLSVVGAAAGSLLIAAVALGVAGLRPASQGTPAGIASADGALAAGSAAPDDGALGNLGTSGRRDDAVPPTADTDPAHVDEPTEEPSATATPAPEPVAVDLAGAWRDGKVRLEWGACEADGVAYWKVVRSADEEAAWPLGPKDHLVAVLEPDARTAADRDAPEGRKSWYRVFAVDGDLVPLCASDTVRVAVPAPEPTEKPTPKPTPEPTEKPTPKPEPADLALAVKLKEGLPLLDWSMCKADAFDYYKVVASRDSHVSWPTGDNDWLVAAISDRGTTALWDKDAPAGKTLWYRVFCVQATGDGYRTLAASPARKITTANPDPGPAPDPVTLGFDATVDGGAVALDWEGLSSDAFVYWKVVRSQQDNPSYLPWTDGTELIGVIEDPGTTSFRDEAVASGETWYYRIQAIGRWNGEKVLLGATRVIRVEIP